MSDSDLIARVLLSDDHHAFGELVPNIRHFIRLHVVKEATVSSKIEGTNTNMEEVLMELILDIKRLQRTR